MNPPLPLCFPAALVSGGQTGADRAALDFAIARGLTHGGYCPRGRKAEDGPIPARYNLQETEFDDYPTRTRMNVEMADATVIFQAGAKLRPRSGCALTASHARKTGRPYLIAGEFPDVAAGAPALRTFLELHHPKILNVAGSRESSVPGISAYVHAVLTAVAERLPAAAALRAPYPAPS